jgi:hypothetical protein
MMKTFKKLLRLGIKRGYVSPIEKFLATYTRTHPGRSSSQLAEIIKFERVARLRDNPVRDKEQVQIWQQF